MAAWGRIGEAHAWGHMHVCMDVVSDPSMHLLRGMRPPSGGCRGTRAHSVQGNSERQGETHSTQGEGQPAVWHSLLASAVCRAFPQDGVLVIATDMRDM